MPTEIIISVGINLILFLLKLIYYDGGYDGGKGAKQSRISPNDATSYFTMSGKSLPRHISKLEHSGVHLMKLLNDFSENSP